MAERVCQALDNSCDAQAIALDISKVFNMSWYKSLHHKAIIFPEEFLN